MIDGKLVGFFGETHAFLTRKVSSFPNLSDCMRDQPTTYQSQLIPYLKAGHEHGYISSRLYLKDPKDRAILTKSGLNLTDGVWIWPWELFYYVESFNVSLPDEFVAHARANNWLVPIIDPYAIRFPGSV